ncbi:ParB/RepB/Spo0J family partition protein [Staphylococcus massiliensis]|uniref:Chromosome (Plasmid) partitioning protein ParB / Stage 0 sporulation protein J n=2 Tax=Staphylococcus massiliensis TaxID=555791 RepID=K9ALJ6_9STAP|nr:chromosome (plasmid) partitioning protein ParB / Stage 0 sporulation protein J [Staphylococcus massiliensis S46]MCG3399560.1 ParB/RepB/Spo0J family partition protein [Staphylococcus massiliensis]POA00992.1 chromosome partitioning protein ParB [Staphylococcus massiliensis CCUG 55927]
MTISHFENDRTHQDDENVRMIALSDIHPNPYQPRVTFDEKQLDDLKDSIKTHGVLQPIILRQTIRGYHIVVGERRYRASLKLGLDTIPAIVKSLSEQEMMELAIIENLQREDLNAIEEAMSYQKLMTELDMNQEEVAKRLGKSRPYIANMLRLLKLPVKIRDLVQKGQLSGAHGRTLLALKNQDDMIHLAHKTIQESYSVRYLEEVVQSYQPSKKPSSKASTSLPRLIQKHERKLKEAYGTDVNISIKKQKGEIAFTFKSESEYHHLIQLLQDRNERD